MAAYKNEALKEEIEILVHRALARLERKKAPGYLRLFGCKKRRGQSEILPHFVVAKGWNLPDP